MDCASPCSVSPRRPWWPRCDTATCSTSAGGKPSPGSCCSPPACPASVPSPSAVAANRRAPRSLRCRPRAVLCVLGVAYAVVAVVMWASPGAVSEHGRLPPARWAPLRRIVGGVPRPHRVLRRDAPAARRGPRPCGDAGRLPAGHAARHRRPRRGSAGAAGALTAAGLLALTVAGLFVLSGGPRVVSPPTRGGAVR